MTQKGVYVIADSIPSATNPTPTWVNITGNIFNLPYTIFGQNYNPTTDPNAITYNLATSLTSIVADWEYTIPNNPANLSAGYHPVLFVSANSGVYMSIDNGQSWSVVSGYDLWRSHGRGVSASRQRHQLDLVAGQHRREYRHAESGGPVRSEQRLQRRQIPISCWLQPSVKVRLPSTWDRCCSRRRFNSMPAAIAAQRLTARLW